MNDLEKQLKQINEKLQVLLKQFHSLQKENTKLKEEVQESRSHHSAHVEELDRLRQRSQILQRGTNEMSDLDKKAFEKRLNGYVKEIDRCIALLNG
jgi:predicted  nucleic acid-binding Zn-ribbon protein